MARVFLYSRVSSGKQAISGYGLARQGDAEVLEQIRKWCAQNGHTLADEDVMQDAGFSAFKGENLEAEAALGMFLEKVKASKVPRGSYLIVERTQSTILLLEIITAGIIVKTWEDRQEYSETSPMIALQLQNAISKLAEAHESSLQRSGDLLDAWDELRHEAAESSGSGHQKYMTPRVRVGLIGYSPKARESRRNATWRQKGRLFCGQQKAAEIVLRILREAASGLTGSQIAIRVNQDGKQPLNCGKKFSNPKHPKFGQPVSQEWNRSRINDIIFSDSLLGWMQPHKLVDGKLSGNCWRHPCAGDAG